MRRVLKLLTVLFTFTLFLACGKKEDNTLKVGMEVGYAPFNWFQNNYANGAVKINTGYANGYDVQIAKIIADKLGKKLEIVQSDWDALLGPALNSGKVDLVIAGVSPTLKRRDSMDFTKSYYKANLVVVLKKDSKYRNAKTVNDFKNAKITGQLNTIHYNVIDQLKGVNKQPAMDNFPTMLVALNSGRIDGYVAEKPSALSASYADPSITYVDFDINNGFKYNHDEIDVAIGVKKGNEKLLKEVDKILNGISQEKREELMKNAIKNQPLAK